MPTTPILNRSVLPPLPTTPILNRSFPFLSPFSSPLSLRSVQVPVEDAVSVLLSGVEEAVSALLLRESCKQSFPTVLPTVLPTVPCFLPRSFPCHHWQSQRKGVGTDALPSLRQNATLSRKGNFPQRTFHFSDISRCYLPFQNASLEIRTDVSFGYAAYSSLSKLVLQPLPCRCTGHTELFRRCSS